MKMSYIFLPNSNENTYIFQSHKNAHCRILVFSNSDEIRNYMKLERIFRFAKKYCVAVGSSLFAATIGFPFAKNRHLLSEISRLVGYDPKLVIPLIPSVAMHEVIDESVRFQLRETIATNGNISLLELTTITRLIARYQPRRLFEIGTFDGRTTLNMAANAPSDATTFTLDLPCEQLNATVLEIANDDKKYIDKSSSGSRYKNTDIAKNIHQLFGDSATFDFKSFENSLDFVFVDGSHSYSYVKNDTAIALKLLKNGKGIIVWHDYDTDTVWEGVTRALNELYKTDARLAGMRHLQGTTMVYLRIT